MIGILLFLYGVLCWFKPRYGLMLSIILLPIYQFKFYIFTIPFTFLEFLIIILFLIWFLKNPKRIVKKKNNLKDWLIPIFIWLVIATGAMFLSPNLRAGAGVWRAYFMEPILFLIVFLDLIKTKKDLKLVFSALVFSGFYVSLWAFGQLFFGGGVWSTEAWSQPQIWRATGPFSHPNFLGLYLGPIIVLGLGHIIFYFRKNTWFIIYCLLFTVLMVSTLILARSEGAILGVLVGLTFWGLIQSKTRKQVLIGLIIIFFLLFLFPFSRSFILEKLFLKDLSGQFRLNIWQGAIKLLRTSPIIGVGLDGYEKLIPNYQEQVFQSDKGEDFYAFFQPHPHNLFLTIWLEMGLLGLLIFFWIIVKFLIQGLKKIKKEPILAGSVISALMVILIHGLVDTPYFKNDLAILFWLIIGLGIIIKNNYENQISNN